MKKTPNQKGFTVLEVIVALLLFSLLMGSLWHFFGETYSLYIKFDHKSDLSEQARIITSFIREEIRLADEVTLTVKTVDGSDKKISPPEHPKTSESSDLIEGEFVTIDLNTASGTGTKKGKRQIILRENTSTEKDQGKYRLFYKANFTESLISDKIEQIKVIREKDASIVQFECILAITRDGEIFQEVQNVFSESLQYKIAYEVTP
ncbi:PilW family protein [Cellulosilyticum sp. I15G10I2]|uniref:PilW family protein n=1 Tax=Cellulosilyticum sp. I15G10I2 TaxID=1892843 RepID=UPI00085CA1B9|nr:prepilin-type N-terminal cleavage/methylation domain-containing protein [Cellulosilyticum sp. I15G10I2]